MARISVIVPTYRRVADLERCLSALDAQERKPDEIVVCVRDNDHPTWEFLEACSSACPRTVAKIGVPGVVAALNAGLALASGDIVAFTDDDATPWPTWLRLIERHFETDPAAGGVGGRDFVRGQAAEREQRVVGRITWYGRMIGNHHLGTGAARYVATLKGVNMSFRRVAIDGLRFDTQLRGTGAQVHNELAFCLDVRRRGWKLIYDPSVAVDHFPSVRHDEDKRYDAELIAFENAAYNETFIFVRQAALHAALAHLGWSIIVGHRALPGVLQCVRLQVLERLKPWQRFPSVLRGRMRGWYDGLIYRLT